MKYNALNANEMTQKISASSKTETASSALKIMLLSNVQGRQDLRTLNVFCAKAISLQITKDIKYIRNYKGITKKHVSSTYEKDNNFFSCIS